MAKPTISYAQRFEDLYLMRCFGSRSDGFYIDIGSGHPVYDSASFAFYLEGWHGVTVEPETKLGELLGEHAPVKSHHHQGFGKLGEGLLESARAGDGTVEALEDPSRRFTLGVLWHPEAGDDLRLFAR